MHKILCRLREAAKNGLFFSGPTTKEGGGERAWALRKKTVFEALKN